METLLSSHLSAAVALIIFGIVRVFLFTRSTSLEKQKDSSVNRTDDPYDIILKKVEPPLAYAADNGIKVAECIRRSIYDFRLVDKPHRNANNRDALFQAYIALSEMLKPITVESLTETSLERTRGVQKYRKIVFILSLFVISFSILTFVSSAMSIKIGQEIDNSNSLIVQLRTSL
ncbi:MAG TPA: hypothetical protein VE843_08615 [Ktedonobacteraceae bacterium]|nr:hypothetical protein [Ktedonobacteraceae bacterium]